MPWWCSGLVPGSAPGSPLGSAQDVRFWVGTGVCLIGNKHLNLPLVSLWILASFSLNLEAITNWTQVLLPLWLGVTLGGAQGITYGAAACTWACHI